MIDKDINMWGFILIVDLFPTDSGMSSSMETLYLVSTFCASAAFYRRFPVLPGVEAMGWLSKLCTLSVFVTRIQHSEAFFSGDSLVSIAMAVQHVRVRSYRLKPPTSMTLQRVGEYEEDSRTNEAAPSRKLAAAASLERAMDGLSESEKYNAVLHGVSSMVMGRKNEGAKAEGVFEEMFQLLDEMNANRIKCTLKTASAVVDAATAMTNISIISKALAKIRRVGVAQKYARDLGRLSLLPTSPSQKERALKGLVPVPDDDRTQEIGYAASFILLLGSDFSWEGVGQVMHYDTTIPTAIGILTASAMAVDVWKRSGYTSKLIINGLNRLFLKDVERESRAEAGAFLVAYITGLPCFAFQPSAVEALRMATDPDLKETFLSGNGIHRILVWLLAGVASEGMVHRQTIASDPRQAPAFLQMVRSRENGCDLAPQDDEERIQWAFNEARTLIKENNQAFEDLRRRLESGGATVGDCVSIIERRT